MKTLPKNQKFHKNPNQITIKNVFPTSIHTNTHGFGNVSIHTILKFVYMAYIRITQSNLKINREKCTTPISPKLPIVILFKQIEESQKFVEARYAAFTEAQLIPFTEIFMLMTTPYKDAYPERIA